MPAPSAEMDSKARQRNRETLWAIWQQVEACQSTFLSPSHLQAFGVEACLIDIADDEALQFEPRFFEPHPTGLLRKYPIDAAGNDYDISRLHCIPTFQDALNTVRESLPVSEDPLEAAQKLFEERLKNYHFWDDYDHADWIHNHLEHVLHAVREGGPPPFYLEDIAGLGGGCMSIADHSRYN